MTSRQEAIERVRAFMAQFHERWADNADVIANADEARTGLTVGDLRALLAEVDRLRDRIKRLEAKIHNQRTEIKNRVLDANGTHAYANWMRRERDSAKQESEQLRADLAEARKDTERLAWWLSSEWDLDEWRAMADAAMVEGN